MIYLLIVFFFQQIFCKPNISKFVSEQLNYTDQFEYAYTASLDSSFTYQWKPIKIAYEFLETYSESQNNYISSIMKTASAFFGRHLMVRNNGESFEFGTSNTYCIDEEIPNILRTKQYDFDLIFFTKIVNQPEETYIAYSGPCMINKHDNRPVFAIMVWNSHYLELDNPTNLDYESSASLAIHEMIHGLGFLDAFFPYYLNHKTMQPYSQVSFRDDLQRLILSTPRLTYLSKQYFGCSTAQGIVMENQGSDGTKDSHLERIIYYNEIMTGTVMHVDFQISDFTFTFFEDTGLYRLSQYSPDQIIWGKGKGCDFIQKSCSSTIFPEFCNTQYGCTYEKNGIGMCVTDSLSDGCSYFTTMQGMDCRDPNNPTTKEDYFINNQAYFGFDSNCFQSSISQNQLNDDLNYSCYKMSCNSDGTVTVLVGSISYDCTSGDLEHKATEPLSGELTCPTNVQEICFGKDDCENQCNQHGICVNRKCTCQVGYSGKLCQDNCNQFRSGDSNDCVPSCQQYEYADTYSQYCIGCSGHCLICTSINVCTQCQQNFYLHEYSIGDTYGIFCEPFTNTEDEDEEEEEEEQQIEQQEEQSSEEEILSKQEEDLDESIDEENQEEQRDEVQINEEQENENEEQMKQNSEDEENKEENESQENNNKTEDSNILKWVSYLTIQILLILFI